MKTKFFNSLARIGEFIVRPKYQGQGIGTSLFNSALKMAKAKSAKFVFLTSNFKRKKARQFYVKRNFKKIGSFFYLKL